MSHTHTQTKQGPAFFVEDMVLIVFRPDECLNVSDTGVDEHKRNYNILKENLQKSCHVLSPVFFKVISFSFDLCECCKCDDYVFWQTIDILAHKEGSPFRTKCLYTQNYENQIRHAAAAIRSYTAMRDSCTVFCKCLPQVSKLQLQDENRVEPLNIVHPERLQILREMTRISMKVVPPGAASKLNHGCIAVEILFQPQNIFPNPLDEQRSMMIAATTEDEVFSAGFFQEMSAQMCGTGVKTYDKLLYVLMYIRRELCCWGMPFVNNALEVLRPLSVKAKILDHKFGYQEKLEITTETMVVSIVYVTMFVNISRVNVNCTKPVVRWRF